MTPPLRLAVACAACLAVAPFGFPVGWLFGVRNRGFTMSGEWDELLALFVMLWLPSAALGVASALLVRTLGKITDRQATALAVGGTFAISAAAHTAFLSLVS